MTTTTQDAERINFRLDRQKKRLIEQAAAVKGLSVTDFAVMTLCREAEEVVRNDQTLVLSDRDRDSFLAALDNPAKPTGRLLKAAAAYKDARGHGKLR